MNPKWVEKMESSIPEEIVHADDCDFTSEIKKQRPRSIGKQKK